MSKRPTLLVDYARIDGSENNPRIKPNVEAYLDVLIEWLQSEYDSMHGHAASQETVLNRRRDLESNSNQTLLNRRRAFELNSSQAPLT